MKTIDSWIITKSWFGQRIRFRCPECNTGLIAKLNEAGNADQCPDCGTRFRVPAQSYVSALNEDKERDALDRRQAKERAAKEKAERKSQRIAEKARKPEKFDVQYLKTKTSNQDDEIIITDAMEDDTVGEDTEKVFARFKDGLTTESSKTSFASWNDPTDSQFNYAALPEQPDLITQDERKRWERCKEKARTWFTKYSNGYLSIASELADTKKLAIWLFEKNSPKGWRHCNFFHNDWETVRFTSRFVPQDFHYHYRYLMDLDLNPSHFFYSCYEKDWAPLGKQWWRRNNYYLDPVEGISAEFDQDIERLYELLQSAQLTPLEARKVKLRADATKQQLIKNAREFDWSSIKGKPPSEVTPKSEWMTKIEVSIDLDHYTVTIDGKTVELDTYIVSYPKYESWVSPEFKNEFRKAATKYHPDLANTDNEKERRKAIMAKLNGFYERKDEIGLRQFLNALSINQKKTPSP